MLVLGRKNGQRIFVGQGKEQITVTLVKICGGNQARIGITAPDGMLIVREEVEAGEEDRKMDGQEDERGEGRSGAPAQRVEAEGRE